MGVPLGDKLHDRLIHCLFGGEIGKTEPLSLQDTEPLLDLIHPGAVNRGKVEPEAGVLL